MHLDFENYFNEQLLVLFKEWASAMMQTMGKVFNTFNGQH